VGATALLVDEDTCATNFMIRDDKMMELVAKDKEPITPFVRKVRSLYTEKGVSSILVIGGSGDYFDVADHVVMMDCYTCHDVTERAKTIATNANKAIEASNGNLHHTSSAPLPFGDITPRCPVGQSFKAKGKVAVRATNVISYGDVELDLSGLEQIVSTSQTNSISSALQKIGSSSTSGRSTLLEVIASIDATLDRDGLDALAPGQFHGGLARPRSFEIAGAVNRLRVDGNMVQKK